MTTHPIRRLASVVVVFLASIPAFAQNASNSCISASERADLAKIQSDFEAAKQAKPGCEKAWGAAGCHAPLQLTLKKFYEDKVRGDADACRDVKLSAQEQIYGETVQSL